MNELERPSLFWRLTSWLWPTNRDSLLWLCCSLVLIGLIDPIIEQQLMVFQRRNSFGTTLVALGCFAGALLGVFSTMAWRKLNAISGGLVIVATLVGCFSLAYSTFLTWGTSTTTSPGWIGSGEEVTPIAVGDGSPVFWLQFLGGIGLASVLLTIIIRGIGFVINLANSDPPSNSRNTRTKLLIGFAILMLTLGVTQNVFFPNGFLSRVDFSQWGSTANQFMMFVGAFIGGAVLLFASRLFATGRWNLAKHILLFILLGLGLFGILASSTSNRYSTAFFQIQLATAFGVVFLLWTATVVNFQNNRLLISTDNRESNDVVQPISKKWPCIWSVLGILATVSFAFGMYFYDPVTLVATRDVDTARYARTIAHSSKNQIRFGTLFFLGMGGFHDLNCQFENEVEADVFGEYVVPGLAAASIDGLTPNIKTHTLTTLQQANLANSTVSSAQLHDLTTVPTVVNLTNIDVVDPDGTVEICGSYLQIQITDDEYRLDSVLQSIKSADNALVSISVGGKQLDKEELDELVRFSQRVPVPLDTRIFKQMVEQNYSSKLTMKNLIVPDEDMHRDFSIPIPAGTNIFSDKKTREYLLSRDISIVLNKLSQAQQFWDVAFVKGHSAAPLYLEKIRTIDLEPNSSLFNNAKSYGWCFGLNQKQEITDLFLPEAEMAFNNTVKLSTALAKVETLCFDRNWLSALHPNDSGRGWQYFPEHNPIEMKGLKSLPNLKRLVLSRKTLITGIDFLNLIPKIEHLQVQLDSSIAPAIDFRVTKQLKSLVYFGTPPRGIMDSLAQLDNLESVVVVDIDDGTLDDPSAVKNLEAYIPGVEIKVVPKAKYQSQPTDKFLEHVAKQAKLARQRMAKPNSGAADEYNSSSND